MAEEGLKAENGAEVQDTTEVVVDSGAPPKPEDPEYQKAMATQESLNKILETHGFDSMEELQAAIDEGGKIKEILGDRDAKSVVKKAAELEKYEEFWAEQEEAKKEADEDPDETIKRLKKEKADLVKAQNEKTEAAERERAMKKALKNFKDTTNHEMEAVGIPKEDRQIVSLFMGVENPALDVDLSKPADVKRVLKANLKMFQDYLAERDKRTITAYLAGKKEVPAISSSDSGQPPAKKDKEIKTVKAASESFRDRLYRTLTANRS